MKVYQQESGSQNVRCDTQGHRDFPFMMICKKFKNQCFLCYKIELALLEIISNKSLEPLVQSIENQLRLPRGENVFQVGGDSDCQSEGSNYKNHADRRQNSLVYAWTGDRMNVFRRTRWKLALIKSIFHCCFLKKCRLYSY